MIFIEKYDVYELGEPGNLAVSKDGYTFSSVSIKMATEFMSKYQPGNKVDADTIMPATLNWVEGYADDHFYRTLCNYCMYPRFVKRLNCGIPLNPMDYLAIVEALTDSGWEELLDELKVNKSEILDDSLPLVRAYTFLSLIIKHEIFRL